MTFSQNSLVKYSIRFTVVMFIGSLSLMVHDSLGVNEKLTPDDVQSIMSTRPALVDPMGQPVRVSSEAEYQDDLASGTYKVQTSAALPIISPKGQIASVDATDVSIAFVKGWKLESLEHQAERILDQKQKASMWLSDWPGMFMHIVLIQFSAILLLGSLFLARAVTKQSFFAFIAPFSRD